MKIIGKQDGRIIIEVNREDRAPFYLLLGAAWMSKDRVPHIHTRWPKFWSSVQNLMDDLKRILG